jgi:hypothetical protein
MKKVMKKAPAKKMMTGGVKNPNAMATVDTSPTMYKGGISKSPAGASTTATRYNGGISKAPSEAMPSAKYGKAMMKKGGSTGAFDKYKAKKK